MKQFREVIERSSLVVEPLKLLFINEFIAKGFSIPDFRGPMSSDYDFTFYAKSCFVKWGHGDSEFDSPDCAPNWGISWIPIEWN